MDEKIERLINWANGKKEFPYTLDINPTDRCNFKCLHCWQRCFEKIDSKYELSEKELTKVVKEAIKMNVKEFEITGGGEPLMRKNVVLKIMKIIKKEERFGNITTNGSLFSIEDVREIVKMKWDRITFSLDGPDKESNDAVRGKGTFELVVNSIKLFNKVKKQAKSKLPILKFNVVITNKNYNKVDKMIELAKVLKVSIVHFDPLTIHSKMGEKFKLKKKQEKVFEKKAKIAERLAKKYKIWSDIGFLNTSFLEKKNEMEEILRKEGKSNDFASLICYEPWWHLVIKTDGSAQPCCLYDEKEENVKNKNLKKIWFGEYFENIRKEMLKGKLSKYCSICNAGQVFENRRIREALQKWMKK